MHGPDYPSGSHSVSHYHPTTMYLTAENNFRVAAPFDMLDRFGLSVYSRLNSPVHAWGSEKASTGPSSESQGLWMYGT
jgi:hypothetical protein